MNKLLGSNRWKCKIASGQTLLTQSSGEKIQACRTSYLLIFPNFWRPFTPIDGTRVTRKGKQVIIISLEEQIFVMLKRMSHRNPTSRSISRNGRLESPAIYLARWEYKPTSLTLKTPGAWSCFELLHFCSEKVWTSWWKRWYAFW